MVVALIWGWFCPLGNFRTQFWLPWLIGRLCATGTEWVEAKDSGQHPSVLRTAPPQSTVNSREALPCRDHEYNYKLNRMCASDRSYGFTKATPQITAVGVKMMCSVFCGSKWLWWQQTSRCQQRGWIVPRKLFHKVCEWRKNYFQVHMLLYVMCRSVFVFN